MKLPILTSVSVWVTSDLGSMECCGWPNTFFHVKGEADDDLVLRLERQGLVIVFTDNPIRAARSLDPLL